MDDGRPGPPDDLPGPEGSDPVRDGPAGAASAAAPALPDLAEDEARLAAYASALADGVDAALPGWVEGAVARVLEGAGLAADGEVAERARRAGQAARVEVGSRVRDLLATDVDRQRANPLALLRTAVRYPTEVLRSVGAPPVARDAVAREQFPDDDYDLTPAGFADLHPDLHEPGLTWGAAKAHVVLRRRRLEGRR